VADLVGTVPDVESNIQSVLKRTKSDMVFVTALGGHFDHGALVEVAHNLECHIAVNVDA
jgi:hypothetical protein